MPLNYYELLEIPLTASAADIRLAYRRQVQRWHPDRHRGHGSHQRFVEIQKAYRVLSDPAERRSYDASLITAVPRSPEPDLPVVSALPGEPLHLLARVRVSALYRPGTLKLSGWVGQLCPRCGGQGLAACRGCGGAGQVLRKRHWTLDHPAGWKPTEALRLAHAGHVGPFYPTPGDVFVELNPLPSHGWKWSRRRQRLEKVHRVPAGVLKQGGSLTIRSPWGASITVRFPGTDEAFLWLRIHKLGLGTGDHQDPAWLYLHVGSWFSWTYRLPKRV